MLEAVALGQLLVTLGPEPLAANDAPRCRVEHGIGEMGNDEQCEMGSFLQRAGRGKVACMRLLCARLLGECDRGGWPVQVGGQVGECGDVMAAGPWRVHWCTASCGGAVGMEALDAVGMSRGRHRRSLARQLGRDGDPRSRST
jgi:hypothetical protein